MLLGMIHVPVDRYDWSIQKGTTRSFYRSGFVFILQCLMKNTSMLPRNEYYCKNYNFIVTLQGPGILDETKRLQIREMRCFS